MNAAMMKASIDNTNRSKYRSSSGSGFYSRSWYKSGAGAWSGSGSMSWSWSSSGSKCESKFRSKSNS